MREERHMAGRHLKTVPLQWRSGEHAQGNHGGSPPLTGWQRAWGPHWWWEGKRHQRSAKQRGSFSKGKLTYGILGLQDPASPLPGVCPKETKTFVHTKTCLHIFTFVQKSLSGKGFSCGSAGKEDSLQKGKATQRQYSGLENSTDCIVHGVAKSRTRLSDFD